MNPSITPASLSPELLRLLEDNKLPTSDLTQARAEFYVSRSGDALLGMVGLEHFADAALLRSLAVAASVRGLGVGSALVRHVETVASSRTSPAVYLLTTTAEQFFSALGYHTLPRSEVPKSIASTAEFSSLCPSSSVLMRKVL
jgi:amino-acid N-acetyltransferase